MNYLRSSLCMLALLGSSVVACSPTYAPAAYSAHYGAPGRLHPNEGEVAVEGGIPSRIAAHVSLPVAPDLRVEAGGETGGGVFERGAQSDGWALGRVGVRRTFRHGLLTGDVEGGVAAGVGGSRCGNAVDPTTGCVGMPGVDGLRWVDRGAGGAYVGGAIGVRGWDILEPFLRGRAQVSVAYDVPVTTFLSALAGLDARLGPIDLWAGVGIASYINRYETQAGFIAEGGISVPFAFRR